jgi:hypothetical protein
MPQATNQDLNHSTKDGAVVLVSGGKFFVRRVPLAPEGAAAAQVELALEELSPFPAGQLFFGFRTDAARTHALVFAAYRRNFTPEETAAWSGAAAVLPDFAVWLGAESVPAAGISLRERDGLLEAVAWDGQGMLPVALLVRPGSADGCDELVAEVRHKAGLAADAPVKIISSAVEAVREKRDVVVRLSDGGAEVHFNAAALGEADVRDKSLLTERRLTLRRDTLLWRVFAGAMGGLAACATLELGLLATHGWLRMQQTAIDAQAATVKQIDLAQSLAKRLEEISAQRLLPFEMLAELQEKRPKSVEFIRASTNGLWRMDIEAQTTNASDLRDFEAEVRRLASVAHVEARDPRTREGLTTFLLEVTFKPGWFKAGGGS